MLKINDRSQNQNFPLDHRLKKSCCPEVTRGQSQANQEGWTRPSPVQSIQLSAAPSGPAMCIACCSYNQESTTPACCNLPLKAHLIEKSKSSSPRNRNPFFIWWLKHTFTVILIVKREAYVYCHT